MVLSKTFLFWNGEIMGEMIRKKQEGHDLSTDLAGEVVKSLFLFIGLAAILFNIAESFDQF